MQKLLSHFFTEFGGKIAHSSCYVIVRVRVELGLQLTFRVLPGRSVLQLDMV